MSESILTRLQAGRNEIHAAKSAFFISGFTFSTWVMMIPSVKQSFAIEADVLGLLLLCIGVSACIAMPMAGVLTRYVSCRRLITAVSLLMSAAVLAVPHLPAVWAFVPALLLLGASVGTLDVAINLNGVLVERACGRRIMSSMHAFYCMGMFLAAGCFSVLADAAGLPVPWIAAVHVALVLSLLLRYGRYYLDYRADAGQKQAALPRGAVFFLGVLCCISFLAEGGVMDWGGVLLSEDKGVPLSSAGFGITAFSIAEFLARLPGDRLVRRFGEKPVVLASTAAAAVCFAAIGWAETLPFLMAFFFLLGAAVANIVPVMYSLLERQEDMPLGPAVAALTSMGYAGILLGPAFLGFVAHTFHIAVVFDFLALLVLCQMALAAYTFTKLRP